MNIEVRMKLIEPNQESYAVCVNEYNFVIFDLLYSAAGYTTIDGCKLKEFENHAGYFFIDKNDKTIEFIGTFILQDKDYELSELIKEECIK